MAPSYLQNKLQITDHGIGGSKLLYQPRLSRNLFYKQHMCFAHTVWRLGSLRSRHWRSQRISLQILCSHSTSQTHYFQVFLILHKYFAFVEKSRNPVLFQSDFFSSHYLFKCYLFHKASIGHLWRSSSRLCHFIRNCLKLMSFYLMLLHLSPLQKLKKIS